MATDPELLRRLLRAKDRLGFHVHTDVKNGDYRWLTVQHPDQPSFQLGLFAPRDPSGNGWKMIQARKSR